MAKQKSKIKKQTTKKSTKNKNQNQKEILESKLTTTALKGALAYRSATAKGYVDIRGTSIPSIRMRNRIHEYASKFYANTEKAELVILMYMKTTQAKVLMKPNVGLREINNTLNKFLRTTTVGRSSRQTLKQYIIDNQTAAEFASDGLEVSEFEEHAEQFFDKATQEAIGAAYASVLK
ncbi:MAG: hypothetical protein ACK5MR_08805 [Cumulibacter sp.]